VTFSEDTATSRTGSRPAKPSTFTASMRQKWDIQRRSPAPTKPLCGLSSISPPPDSRTPQETPVPSPAAAIAIKAVTGQSAHTVPPPARYTACQPNSGSSLNFRSHTGPTATTATVARAASHIAGKEASALCSH
jgi:hypothetical protein